MLLGNVGGPGDIDFTPPITGPLAGSTARAAGAKKKADKTPDVAAKNAQTVSTEVFSFFKGPKLSGDAKDKLTDLILGNKDNESTPRNLGNA